MAPVSQQEVLSYMYDKPPWLFVVFWVVSPCLALVTCFLAARGVLSHVRAATDAGYAWKRGISASFGPRADRVISLLCLPPTFALTGLMEVFLPRTATVAELVRTAHFSWATIRTVELMYILIGGKERLQAGIPDVPIKAFNYMPCCCIGAWPCFLRKVSLSDLRLMTLGMKQFVYLAPLISLFDVMFDSARMGNDSRTSAVTICLTLSSMIGMWSFNSMRGLFAISIGDRLGPKFSATGCFALAHLLLSKILGVVLRLGIRENFDNDIWIMPMEHYSSMVAGFVLCFAEVLLAFHALRVFDISSPLLAYPPCDKEHAYPVDIVAQLELGGVDVSSWKLLQHLSQSTTLVNAQDIEESNATRNGSSTRDRNERIIEIEV